MRHLDSFYKSSLMLLTDLYQLTMAYGYWKLGKQNDEAVFHLYVRNNPFGGGFAIASGLADVVELLNRFHFETEDLEYLATFCGNDGRPLFEPAFLDALRATAFSCDVDAIPEGTVVFPNEPLVRVRGPILQCQLLETALLTLVNFSTLIATKAARVCLAAEGQPVLEFGLRRAQGIDGGISASRAAYVGGCVATSNVLAGQLFDIPVKGSHAHSWVMSFDDEMEAFEAYAGVMPNNCVLLVDTYDTVEAVRKATKIGRKLAANGHQLIGIRLDSGDLAYLSIEARKILDDAGLTDAKILATNDLDEHIITSLKQQGARIDIWGVGTKLVTAYDQPALGGVYKLGAIREANGGEWKYKAKISEQLAKVSTPGILQVRRFRRNGQPIADAIYSEPIGIEPSPVIVDPLDVTRQRPIDGDANAEDLLVPVFCGGQCVYAPPSIHEIRERAIREVHELQPGVRRFVNPHRYPVGLERRLNDLRMKLTMEARGAHHSAGGEP